MTTIAQALSAAYAELRDPCLSRDRRETLRAEITQLKAGKTPEEIRPERAYPELPAYLSGIPAKLRDIEAGSDNPEWVTGAIKYLIDEDDLEELREIYPELADRVDALRATI
jgi:glycogen debranching enzyme